MRPITSDILKQARVAGIPDWVLKEWMLEVLPVNVQQQWNMLSTRRLMRHISTLDSVPQAKRWANWWLKRTWPLCTIDYWNKPESPKYISERLDHRKGVNYAEVKEGTRTEFLCLINQSLEHRGNVKKSLKSICNVYGYLAWEFADTITGEWHKHYRERYSTQEKNAETTRQMDDLIVLLDRMGMHKTWEDDE